MRRILLGAAMAAMLAGAGLGPLPAQAQGNLFQPLVYVNDSAVTRYELDQRVRFMQLLRAPDSDPVTAEKALIDLSLKRQQAAAQLLENEGAYEDLIAALAAANRRRPPALVVSPGQSGTAIVSVTSSAEAGFAPDTAREAANPAAMTADELPG